VVDATYLATASLAHTPLAVAVADGDASVGWQLIARTGIATILELRGRTVLAPVGDGQHTAFVDHALLGGELPPGFWRVEPSPDAASAVAAVGLGKADAAVAPLGLALPGGVAGGGGATLGQPADRDRLEGGAPGGRRGGPRPPAELFGQRAHQRVFAPPAATPIAGWPGGCGGSSGRRR
jgi:hypothetical protein